MTTNFQRTKAWLEACGKEQTADNLSVQIGGKIGKGRDYKAPDLRGFV